MQKKKKEWLYTCFDSIIHRWFSRLNEVRPSCTGPHWDQRERVSGPSTLPNAELANTSAVCSATMDSSTTVSQSFLFAGIGSDSALATLEQKGHCLAGGLITLMPVEFEVRRTIMAAQSPGTQVLGYSGWIFRANA